MTEKEKAKAYDEAIERAKKLYSNGIAEEIFPELKEDDTERIRKNCIHFLELQKQHHAATFEIEECIDWLEKQDEMHIWTIQDAKDGDVLCCKSGWMCIFKSLNNHTNTFSSYCFMDSDKCFFNSGSECHTLDKEFINAYNGLIHPATKEQRDTLMKVMNDAGYKWDAEKKELRKEKVK